MRGELRPGGSGREWCDAEVVRRLRRASLAALRREIEPADPRALGRFLPDWQRVDRPGAARGVDALREALAPPAGARPAGRPVGGRGAPAAARRLRPGAPRRARRPRARSSGWARAPAASAAGGWRSTSARTRRCSGPPPADPAPRGRRGRRAARRARRRRQLLGRPARRGRRPPREDVFATLWALVWAGEVTNDLWLPLRAPRRLPPPPRPGAGGSRRRRVGGAGRGAPSAVVGRWSLAEPPLPRRPPAGRAAPRAWPSCSWSGTACSPGRRPWRRASRAASRPLYTALADLETLGACRRGYFVAGLGGAQFAMPGAVERLRDLREAPPGERAADGRAGRRRPRPAVRRRGAVAAARGRPLAVARLRRPGRAGGRRPARLPRARRARHPHLRARRPGLARARPAGPRRPGSWPTAAAARRWSASTGSRCSARPLEAVAGRGRLPRRPARRWCCAHRRRRTGRGRVPAPPRRS